MDVLAVHLEQRKLAYIETSSDAHSWKEREERIARKFKTAEPHYLAHVGMQFTDIRRIAVVGARRPKKPMNLPGIEVFSFDDLMREIKAHVRGCDPGSHAIPEGYGYLRAVQFAYSGRLGRAFRCDMGNGSSSPGRSIRSAATNGWSG
jgi:hypothetical protein